MNENAPHITQHQLDALAKLLRADTSSNRFRVAQLVLVNGSEIGAAAREVGVSYNAAHQAVAAYREGLTLAKTAAGVFNAQAN